MSALTLHLHSCRRRVAAASITRLTHTHYQGGKRFNLFSFWADHKSALPLHEKVFRAEVGPKKAAAANVESVFSGAGKFTDEAKSAGHKLVSRITKLHYDWKYDFLHPTSKQVVDRYNKRFRPTVPTPDS